LIRVTGWNCNWEVMKGGRIEKVWTKQILDCIRRRDSLTSNIQWYWV